MKKYFFGTIFALVFHSVDPRLSAQILDVGQFKGVVYTQGSQAPPVAPDPRYGYYFATQLDTDSSKALAYSLPMVFTSSESNSEFVMNEDAPFHDIYDSPYYTSKTDFDADYPNGSYNYVVTYSDPNSDTPESDNVIIQVPADDLYSSNLPAFSPDCWKAMQNVDPSMDFELSWNSYSQMPGTDYAYTFVATYDSHTFDSTYGGFDFECPPYIDTTIIPAGALDYGRTYMIQLFFSNRVTPPTTNEDGSGVSTIIGFDDLTLATLVTMPPALQISLTGQCVTLTWPSAATNYTLQVTHQLDANSWCNVTNSPTVAGSINSLNVPAKHAQAFFRLAPM